ncbi:hypothetical protein AVEN_219579-1 [Araneus ventricosus]|uniref:Uncharacterized protein n=1 Tax=Araneus ventricosus TaxID=182803 RepID=A0A4Y2T8T7_ARAVE|nr:hypothetical protein AVEN_219579-1 [Araneus ventricosus]
MLLSSTYQGVPLPDLPVSSKILCSNNTESNIYKNFHTDLSSIIKFVRSLMENLASYRNEETDDLLKKTADLFNCEYLYFPKSDLYVEQSSEYKGVNYEDFNEFAQTFPCYSVIGFDQQTVWFEWKQLWLWFTKTVGNHRAGNTQFDVKKVLKLAVHELREELPHIIKFLTFCISIPVSKAICESWGSVIKYIIDKRTRADDGISDEIGTTVMTVFIAINRPPTGYKSVRKLLKTALVQKYGIHDYTQFQNVFTYMQMQNSIKSKVVSRILEDDSSVLPCFK